MAPVAVGTLNFHNVVHIGEIQCFFIRRAGFQIISQFLSVININDFHLAGLGNDFIGRCQAFIFVFAFIGRRFFFFQKVLQGVNIGLKFFLVESAAVYKMSDL